MKKTTVSCLANLFLSSTLFWGAPRAEADELVVKEAASLSLSCHMQFPDLGAGTPSWNRPVTDEGPGNLNDLYGSCGDDAERGDEIQTSVESRMKITSGMANK